MNKIYLTLPDMNIIAAFLSKHGDDIYKLCQKKGLNFQTSNDINYFFIHMDNLLDEIVSTFEIELILFKEDTINSISKSRNRRIKNIAFSDKLQHYFFGYQPAISHLFNFSSALLTEELPTKTLITDPNLKPVTSWYIRDNLVALEEFLKFNIYMENISIISDYSDTSPLFSQNEFKHEFNYLLFCFKQ